MPAPLSLAPFYRAIYPIGRPLITFLRRGCVEVRCLPTCGSQVLLVRHTYGSSKWSLPGGASRHREDLSSAAAREVFEEVGLRLRSIVPFKGHRYTKNGKASYFYGAANTTRLKIDRNEIAEAAWFEVSELPVDILTDAAYSAHMYRAIADAGRTG